jgi:hypothetical protein
MADCPRPSASRSAELAAPSRESGSQADPLSTRRPRVSSLATWYVADLESVVDELISRGVTFERYDDLVLKTDEKGIHELDDGRVAWFTDPDGNSFAVEQEASS